MIYVALLRGINVGGKNKVDMKLLKESFVRIGMQTVVTYINSGNVIFKDDLHTKSQIEDLIENVILEDFALVIKVLICKKDVFDQLIKILPISWKNDDKMKCDVLFLWEIIDSDTLLSELQIRPEIDMVIYTPGVILWAVDRENVTKSGLMKLAGTKLYKHITARNVNTTRKIYEIMKEL